MRLLRAFSPPAPIAIYPVPLQSSPSVLLSLLIPSSCVLWIKLACPSPFSDQLLHHITPAILVICRHLSTFVNGTELNFKWMVVSKGSRQAIKGQNKNALLFKRTYQNPERKYQASERVILPISISRDVVFRQPPRSGLIFLRQHLSPLPCGSWPSVLGQGNTGRVSRTLGFLPP